MPPVSSLFNPLQKLIQSLYNWQERRFSNSSWVYFSCACRARHRALSSQILQLSILIFMLFPVCQGALQIRVQKTSSFIVGVPEFAKSDSKFADILVAPGSPCHQFRESLKIYHGCMIWGTSPPRNPSLLSTQVGTRADFSWCWSCLCSL